MSTKRKLPSKLGAPLVKPSAKNITNQGNVDESRAVVSKGGDTSKSTGFKPGEVVDISSDSSSGIEEEESGNEDEQKSTQSDAEEDVTMQDADGTDAVKAPITENNEEEASKPTFGDLVHASEPIDVAQAFDNLSPHAATHPQTSQIQPPPGASLGTVLTQALKTNDVSLLESCLQTREVSTIRATIQRLESPLAGALLQKLAERLHRKPGRAGTLMVWVQWTLVTHGGYLATQRDLMKKLAELNKVIGERAKSLQILLSLKGKLDMLEAQIELRRSMQIQRRREEDEDDDEGVIYVEGEESEDEKAGVVGKSSGNAKTGDNAEGESEDMPNGVIQESEDEDDESSDDLIDDEAEETDAESGDEHEIDHNDLESLEGEEESDDGARESPPPKMRKTGASMSKKR